MYPPQSQSISGAHRLRSTGRPVAKRRRNESRRRRRTRTRRSWPRGAHDDMLHSAATAVPPMSSHRCCNPSCSITTHLRFPSSNSCSLAHLESHPTDADRVTTAQPQPISAPSTLQRRDPSPSMFTCTSVGGQSSCRRRERPCPGPQHLPRCRLAFRQPDPS
jgi:hypothetical protein